MSAEDIPIQPGAPPAKRRNAVERALVWGLIVVLLALTSVEGWSRYTYQRAYDRLGDIVAVSNERGAGALIAADVKAHLGGRQPSHTEAFLPPERYLSNGATHLEIYSWFTLNPYRPRELFVYYDGNGPELSDEAQVVGIQSVAEELVSMPSAADLQTEDRNAKRMMKRKSTSGMPSSGMPITMPHMKPPGGLVLPSAPDANANRHADQRDNAAADDNVPESDKSEK